MTTTVDQDKDKLRDIIRLRSLRKGDFTLSSGRKSNYYLDCRLTTLDPHGALLIGRLIVAAIRENHIQAAAIGGLTMGADPIVASVAVVSAIEEAPIHAFIVRKEAKGHGMQRFIEGFDAPAGTPVIIVDDVVTSGASIMTAAERAEAAGFKVVAAFCVVDREEGGAEIIRAKYPLYSLFTARDLL